MESGLTRHEPLYLKYRPQQLADLVGQPAVVRTLTNAINHERLSHAYLFTGPRGTGKTSTARILAKSLNCEKGPTATPCLECTQCKEIRLGTSPAVFEIDAASNNSVDDARVLIERAPLVAVGGRFKLYIIDECHMLTKEAFNALLKTIEEPPPQVVFVLATTEEHKVPPTIVSRCQRLMFRLVSQEDLTQHLCEVADKEKIEIEEEPIKVIARRSGGGLRDALGLLDQSSLLAAPGKPVSLNDLLLLMGALQEDVLLEISGWILERQGEAVLSAVSRLLMEGREPSQLAMELARHFLNLMKASYVSGSGDKAYDAAAQLIIGSPEYIAGLIAQAGKCDRSELSQIVEQLNRLEQTCRRTTQPALHLEIGLLSLCHRHDMVAVKKIDERVAALEEAIRSGTSIVPPAVQRPPARPMPPTLREPERQEARPQTLASPEQIQNAPATVAGVVQFTQQTWAKAADALAGGVDPSEPGEKPALPGSGDAVGVTPGVRSDDRAREEAGETPTLAGSGNAVATTPGGARSDDLAREEAGETPTLAGSGETPRFARSDDSARDETGGTPVRPEFDDATVGANPPAARSDAPARDETGGTPALPGADDAVRATPPVARSDGRDETDAVPVRQSEQDDLEEFWQQLLDEVSSMPSIHGILSSYPFPVSFNQQEFTIGVINDMWRNNVEKRLEPIKTACERILGRPIAIKVKVVSTAPARPVPRERAGARASRAGDEGSRGEEKEDPEPTSPAKKVLPKSPPPDPRNGEQGPSSHSSRSTLVREADQLFQGPGSRRIT